MASKKILFAGLPSSGKTTFIAALWYFLTKSPENCSLSLESSIGENEYLNDICETWLSFKPVSRTNPKSETTVLMNIKNNSNGEKAILEIPDFSGEVFRDHFDTREWSKEHDELLNEVDGILLFINPSEERNRPQFITLENEILRYFGEEPEVKPTQQEEFNLNFVPHQVKLVEILQFMEFYKPKKKPMKVSIVISAWDLVMENYESKSSSPVKWTATHLPLLFQYIVSNENIFNVQYFGVSAQGGDYDSEEIEELMKKKPEERIHVREEDSISTDITKPILWTIQ